MHNFKNLKVCQKSANLAVKIYHVTANFPASDKFGMTSQMRRAEVSISSKIAEGTAKSSSKSFSNSLEIRLGESCELETQMIIAEKFNLIFGETAHQLDADISEIQKMIIGFKSTVTT